MQTLVAIVRDGTLHTAPNESEPYWNALEALESLVKLEATAAQFKMIFGRWRKKFL